MGRGKLRKVRLAGLTELGKARMDGIGMMWRTRVLGRKVFPAEAVGKENIIIFILLLNIYNFVFRICSLIAICYIIG